MEFLVLGLIGLVGLLAVGVLLAVASLLWWIVTLPFRILGWLVKGFLFLIALPFLVLFTVLGVGLGFFFLLPLGSLLLLGLLVWGLFRLARRKEAPVAR